MPDPITHFAVPFIAMRLLKKDYKIAVLAGVVGILPDFDVLSRIHRSVTHSIVLHITIIAILACILILSKVKSNIRKWILIAVAFGLISHSVMDMFYDYTPILYPILQHDILIHVDVSIHIQEGQIPQILPKLEILLRETNFTPFINFEASLTTGQTIIISALLLFTVLTEEIYNGINNKRIKLSRKEV
mgnify:CR=1 FL=1